MTGDSQQIIDGRYQIKQKLGEGAMGVVYRATALESGQTVAVKALKPQAIVENPVRLERFIREAEGPLSPGAPPHRIRPSAARITL